MPFDKSAPIGRRWAVRRALAKNSRGEILVVQDRQGKEYAAKAEASTRNHSSLRKELEVLQALHTLHRNPVGFTRVHFSGKHGRYDVVVMDLLGESLAAATTGVSKRNRLEYTLGIADQALDRIQTLHQCGFLHRDIKPENFVFSKSGSGRLYMIDFGLSTRYRDRHSNEHILKSREKYFNGTSYYASVNSQRLVTQSRRDDLESLGYMLIEMMIGRLPWDEGSEISVNSEVLDDMFDLKENISLRELCKGLPECFLEYMMEVTSLSFTETPHYSNLRKLFKDEMRAIQSKKNKH